MAKFCTNCGNELGEGDKFCAKCGTPVGGAATQAQPEQWEYCDVKYEIKAHYLQTCYLFYGEVRGPHGITRAVTQKYFGTSQDVLGCEENRKNAGAVAGLVQELVSQGWVPLSEHGRYWYNYKFRRPVRR